MKKDLTLLVLAAGMGSRFGGLKQIEPVGPNNEFIIDYSVYDAIRSGFTKVVFIIKEENYDIFKETIGARVEPHIKTEYVFQNNDLVPDEYQEYVKNRVKPLGTGHAILCAKNNIHEPFAVINADDFYGSNAFLEAAKFLREVEVPYIYANISYEYGVTKSLEGAVKRGVLSLDGDKINSIIECSVGYEEGRIMANPLNGDKPFEVTEDAPVSMNFFAFQHDIFALLEDYWESYFKQSESVILEGEVLLSECLKENIEKGIITILNQPSSSVWLGMTYRSDLEFVKKEINALKGKGEYNTHLWEDVSGKE